MKVSVIGTGKTGGTVLKLLGDNAVGFNEVNPPSAEKIKGTDIAIVFVPGGAAEEIIELLLEAEVPAVWGTTGYAWPADLSGRVQKINKSWIIGSNFSLGMNLVRKAINLLGKGAEMLPRPQFHIHEIHHAQKKDAPSGTALSWQEWLGRDALISSDRQGDVKGIHNLHIKTDNESIHIKHEAHNREVFAEGAIWSAEYLLAHPQLEPGVHSFASVFDRAYKELL
ncbi:MAG: dihydrodipicolinate reductase C-terminal domain-containing protein [Balneolaceae bacterium]